MRLPSFIRLGTVLLSALAVASGFAAEPLATAAATRHTVKDLFVTDARIEAVHQATVAAETTGRIKEILFDVDDLVAAGEVLLRFTDTEQRAQVARADAALREAEARLRESQEEHVRITQVYAQKLVAKAAMDKAEADLKAAQQRVAAAVAGVEQAKQQLEYTVVRAPYAGIVVERLVSVGERVGPGTPLMTGFSLHKLRASAHVPQSRVEAIRKHAQVAISLDTVDQPVPVSGKAITIYPYADATAHTFTVRMELSSVPKGYYPGMFAKAAFVVGEKTSLFVPAASVVRRSEVTAVYVVNAQGQVGFRAVRTGRSQDGQLEILAGLSEGELVALDPVLAGATLKAQRAAALSATPAEPRT